MANAFIITAAHWDAPSVKTAIAVQEETANTWAAKMVGDLKADRGGYWGELADPTADNWRDVLADLQRMRVERMGDIETAGKMTPEEIAEASECYVTVEAVPFLEPWPSPVIFTPGPVDHAAIAAAIRAIERPLIVDSSHMSNGDVERMVEGMRAGGAKIPVLEYGQPIGVPEPIHVIVVMEGGFVQDVMGTAAVRCTVLDYDVEGADTVNDLTYAASTWGSEAFRSERGVDADPDGVARILAAPLFYDDDLSDDQHFARWVIAQGWASWYTDEKLMVIRDHASVPAPTWHASATFCVDGEEEFGSFDVPADSAEEASARISAYLEFRYDGGASKIDMNLTPPTTEGEKS